MSRWKPNGLPEFTALFWSKVTKTETCWLWTGATRGSLGYGAVKLPGCLGQRTAFAHRVSFFLTHGHWPNGSRHQCDTPLCVRPDHILEGNAAQNMQDQLDRNRARNGNIKLNPQIWAAIRASSVSASKLAALYGVHDSHIRKIRRGVTGNVYRPKHS